jgi:uncharacterized damage-inducible protein DinB
MSHELEVFLKTCEGEAPRTIALLKSLPEGKYDFRPDPDGRSLGELAWHLAEVDAYMGHGVSKGKFDFGDRPAGIERPRTIAELAPGYERINRDAIAKLRALGDIDLETTVTFFDGRPMPIRRILWDAMLHHQLHHRGQLTLMCRLAGGTPPGLYGPTREEMAAMKARG